MEKLEEENTTVSSADCFADFRRGLHELKDMVRNMIQKINMQENLEINGLESMTVEHEQKNEGNTDKRKQEKKAQTLDSDGLNKIIKKKPEQKEEEEAKHQEQMKEDKETLDKIELSWENEDINDFFKQYDYYIKRNKWEKRKWQILDHWIGNGGLVWWEGEGEGAQLLKLKVKVRKKKEKLKIGNWKFK